MCHYDPELSCKNEWQSCSRSWKKYRGSLPQNLETLEFDCLFLSLALSACPCLHFKPPLVSHDNPGEWHQQKSVGQRRETASHRKSQNSEEGSKTQNGRMINLKSHTSGKHADQTGYYWCDGTVQSDGWPLIPTYSPFYNSINDETSHFSVLDLEFFLNVSSRVIVQRNLVCWSSCPKYIFIFWVICSSA